jgi:transposase InsO family protein
MIPAIMSKKLEFYQFQISMSRKANPCENAYAKSFIKTLKLEEAHLWECCTIGNAQRRISYFIEDAYNHKRLHYAGGHSIVSFIFKYKYSLNV